MSQPSQAIYGDTLFIHGNGLAHKAIRYWTNSIVDHTANCEGPDLAWDSRPLKGVTSHGLDVFCENPWILLRPKTPITLSMQTRGTAFLEAQKGKKYDWFAIAGFPLGKLNLNDVNRWICSELTRTWYETMGIVIIERTPMGLTSPQALFGSKEFTVVEHNLNDPALLEFIKASNLQSLRLAVKQCFALVPTH